METIINIDGKNFLKIKTEDIEVLGRPRYRLEIYKGRLIKGQQVFSMKNLNRYYYDLNDRRQTVIDEFISDFKKRLESKKEWQDKKKAQKNEMINKVKVGDIFVNSWRYEQTNIDAYQVIEKNGARVKLQEIGYESTTETSHDSDRVRPIRGAFIAGKEAFTKIISTWGISFDHGSGDLWDGVRDYHRSWGY